MELTVVLPVHKDSEYAFGSMFCVHCGVEHNYFCLVARVKMTNTIKIVHKILISDN